MKLRVHENLSIAVHIQALPQTAFEKLTERNIKESGEVRIYYYKVCGVDGTNS